MGWLSLEGAGVDRSWVNPIDWVWLIWDKQGEEGLTRFIAMGWSLWNARNSVMFRESVKIPFVLCRDVERYLQEFQDAQCQLQPSVTATPRRLIRWSLPESA